MLIKSKGTLNVTNITTNTIYPCKLRLMGISNTHREGSYQELLAQNAHVQISKEYLTKKTRRVEHNNYECSVQMNTK